MDTRREFLKKSLLLSGAAGLSTVLPLSIQRAFAIDPVMGSSYLDAEHVVILMQENRSFDHCFGMMQGVRGFNDPRVITQPNQSAAWLQSNAVGDTYLPFRLDIKDSKVTWMGSLPHSRASQVDAYNGGKFDQWLEAKRSGNKKYADVPLTMGHYTRDDLPFNYALADAFTVCDQNFCSGMTSTTPNRSFFWTGKITHDEDGLPKANIRNTDFSYGKMPWQTFPELLEQNNIPWKFYQNALSCGGGFVDEERAWLANFGCNLLEFFKTYNVKFSEYYIKNLQKQVDTLPDQISKLQERSPSSDEAAQKVKESIRNKQAALDKAQSELIQWNHDSFEKLSEHQKNLYRSAFVINSKDADYRTLSELTYADNGKKRKVSVPKGDLLYQFRDDVEKGKLPTVSWLAAPENFSDHPTAPWYGAWYVSEVLDILTKNPEVWKKTIFIMTYDENDGYFDHIPPFSIPDNKKPGTGKCSVGIDTEIEHVRLENELAQGIPKRQAREAPIGLGFRVPMIIASPWSRGGQVCSQVFDHTSTLQFLEGFVNKKFSKNLHLDNISKWRRTICGDLTAAFTPFNGEKLNKLPFLKRDAHVEMIYNAKFKDDPAGYKKLTGDQIALIGETAALPGLMPEQEKGVRASCPLPYQLYAHGKLSDDKKSVQINFEAAKDLFGARSAGSPFTVYAPVKYQDENDRANVEVCRNWSFAAAAGDRLAYNWPIGSFENNKYHLRVNGPNGFYREFKGAATDPLLDIRCDYERNGSKAELTGNVVLNISGKDISEAYSVEITHHGSNAGAITRKLVPGRIESLLIDLRNTHNWYDLSIKIAGLAYFEQRYAGKVETGKTGFTDPVMGKTV